MRRRHHVIVLAAACACSRPDELHQLRDRAVAIAEHEQPALDALVGRIARLKQDLRGNLPGWESALRTAELANDELGLPPFTQTEPPGAGWQPSPASLLGIRPYVEVRAADLARAGRTAELQFLVEDERARYARGIADVAKHIAEVERWLNQPR
jgi:hypothetical protein